MSMSSRSPWYRLTRGGCSVFRVREANALLNQKPFGHTRATQCPYLLLHVQHRRLARPALPRNPDRFPRDRKHLHRRLHPPASLTGVVAPASLAAPAALHGSRAHGQHPTAVAVRSIRRHYFMSSSLLSSETSRLVVIIMTVAMEVAGLTRTSATNGSSTA